MAGFVSNETGGGDWRGVGTWVGPARPPQAGDTVTIKAGDTISLLQIAACDEVTDIEATGTLALSTFKLDVGGGLTLNGTISGSGDLDFEALTYVAGTNTNTGTWTHTASGNVVWNTGTHAIADLSIAGSGVNTTVSAVVYARKITLDGGTLTLNAAFIVLAAASDFWTDAGTETIAGASSIEFRVSDNISQKACRIPQATALHITNTKTLTATDSWNFITDQLTVRCSGAGTGTADMASYGLTCGILKLGRWDTDGRWGHLNLGSGRSTIASMGKAKSDDTSGNLLTITSDTVVMSGTFDAGASNPIAVTNTSGQFISGTLTNVSSLTGPLKAWGCLDGGGNDVKVEFAPRGNTGAMAGAAA